MVIELGGSVFEITHDLVGDLFRAKNAGVTHLEDMSSPRSETEWINLSIGLRTHYPAERGVRTKLRSTSAEPYIPAG
jgi:hypothetical protein